MRRLSLNARQALETANSGDPEILLIRIDHESLSKPVRLSTDPTERLSVEPLIYGTRSIWFGANLKTDPYLFALVKAEFPSDLEDAPATARIILENVSNDIAAQLRAITNFASVAIAVVLSSSPNVVEAEFRNLKLVKADGDANEFSLNLSRLPIEEESFPTDRMTKQRAPGLHR
ncbi:hypothetical protein K1718_13375 [Roseibium porphyridii]|uniref:DUF1833 domain-containing protein n=1 Tax=Roseibium porphyridii TaxID=2866279 RepID=A0ABY8FEM5_9HYPH|nr:hypothetical protein [Roseibium sp. KMA01]WFE92310.1 hypothetical protein K1718_13375 [Roseibium sp. KMA01]